MQSVNDFSCKHDQMIRNSDGTLHPMDEPYYEAEQVASGTWKILSSGDYSYLLAGSREGIAIDTGYGAGNILKFFSTLTDKPVTAVINTHDHFDHTANNGYFLKAYMSEKTLPLSTIPFPSFSGIKFMQNYKRVVVSEGDILDIGERKLEIFSIPDHAVGSIAILDRNERLLFTGDEFMISEKRLNRSVSEFLFNIEKLEKHRNEFDRICAGGGVFGADLIDRYRACALHILEGNEGEQLGDDTHTPKFEKDNSGRYIYDRMMPHPEDYHPDFDAAGRDYLRIMKYCRVSIIYDIRKQRTY
jgi:glyoxylase-like metal-dependent hydrolase (beta-lactamase superfamily II)